VHCHRLQVDQHFNEIEKEKDFIDKRGITKEKPITPKADLLTWYIDAAPIVAIISSAVLTRGAVITIGSIIGVPTIVFVVVLVGRPGTQETPYCRVLLSRLVVVIF
jgi:hypothetical protein